VRPGRRNAQLAGGVLTDPVLEIKGLKVAFRQRDRLLPVVEDVSLHIDPGEAYGVVGESGRGKTTLALSLMRYLPANGRVEAGAIAIDGEDVLALSDERLQQLRGTTLAMVYQDPAAALNPAMRVGDQIAEVFRFHHGLSRRDALEQARASVERVAIPDPAVTMRRYPFQLSGGQQQRVVIAMALAGDPRLLVLDEPTTGLDATVEAEVLDLISELRGKIDAAIMLISHNLGTVARLCERVGVMYAGRMVEEGPACDLFTEPRHPYTMGLLQCVPRFGAHKDTVSLCPIPGSVPPLGTAMPGCVFASRCELAEELCRQTAPELLAFGDGARHTRCHFPDRVPGMTCATGRVREEARTPAEGTVLEVKALSKTFRSDRQKLIALDGISVQIAAGETFGLVGESGSGKTTLANCIAGLVEADGGQVVFLDKVLGAAASRRDAAALREIQMVFQNPDSTLNPSWSIRSILKRSVQRLSGVSRAQAGKRVEELARLVSFEPRYLENKSTELSGGQKQRAAIARAFAGSPTLVICDEPASALDVSVQATILNLLDDLQRSAGVTYIFISHDLAVVRYLSDRIGVMYLGWLIEVGAADEVFAAPHHPYTEALVSAIPTLDFDHPTQRIPLHGATPSLADAPSGCRFHTRCLRKLGEICEQDAPPWREVSPTHSIRCHIPPEELGARQRERARAPQA